MTLPAAPSIWLFRNAAIGDPYSNAFQRAGFLSQTIPVLETEYLDPEPLPGQDFDAVLVTSQRSVRALSETSKLSVWLQNRRGSTAYYAVGPATERALSGLGIETIDLDSGKGADLAHSVVDSGAKSVLYLAGDPHRSEMPEILRARGVEVVTLLVYRTLPRIPMELRGKPTPDWAAFFSPRGAETALSVPDVDWRHIRKAAIGPTTARALADLGWPAEIVATRPDPETLIHAVESA